MQCFWNKNERFEIKYKIITQLRKTSHPDYILNSKLITYTTASCWEPQYCLTTPELYRIEEFMAFWSLKFRLMALRSEDDKLISSIAHTSSDLPEW